MKKTQAWLLAGALGAAFTFAPTARAADPVVTPPSSSSKAWQTSVKPRFEPPQRQARILGLQLPTFIALGLGSLSAGGAVATRFAASRGNDPDTCESPCTERTAAQHRWLVASGVLAGMAAAGVGAGITLMLTAPKDQDRDAVRPRLALGLSGQKAVAKVGWAFSSF